MSWCDDWNFGAPIRFDIDFNRGFNCFRAILLSGLNISYNRNEAMMGLRGKCQTSFEGHLGIPLPFLEELGLLPLRAEVNKVSARIQLLVHFITKNAEHESSNGMYSLKTYIPALMLPSSCSYAERTMHRIPQVLYSWV